MLFWKRKKNKKICNGYIDGDSPPYRWKPVRVFLSSTFRDFHAERDYLIKYVFPELRMWCEQWRLNLVDIDLRWGITAAEAESGKVIDICLSNVEGSRPYFLCMLGSRYGWVPSQKDIPNETSSQYHLLKKKKYRGFSITQMEIHHAFINPLDDPLESKTSPFSYFYFRDPDCFPVAKDIAHWTNKQHLTYESTFFDANEYGAKKLEELKSDIEKHLLKIVGDELENHLFHYTPEYDERLDNPEDPELPGRFTSQSLKEFGDRIITDLKQGILTNYEKRIRTIKNERYQGSLKDQNNKISLQLKQKRLLDNEDDFHNTFVELRTQHFIGRSNILGKIKDYIGSADTRILALQGLPGSGKSALLAKSFLQAKKIKLTD